MIHMRIIMVYNYDPSNSIVGGGFTYVHNLIMGLLSEGINVTLLGKDIGKQTFKHENFEFIPVQEGSSFWKFLFNLQKSIKSLKLSDSDIIHTHHPLAMRSFIKVFPKNPKLCTFHGVPLDWVQVNYHQVNSLIGPVYRYLEKNIINNIDMITSAGPYTRMRLIQRYPKLDLEDKIISIPSAVNLDVFKPMNKYELRKEFGLDEFSQIILFVGRLAEIKNLNLLIKSYSIFKHKFENSVLVIVGRGEKEKEIKEQANKLGLNNVIFTGALDPSKVVQYVNCADILALTSFFESSPTVLREAISCGIPVVTTNVGDVEEIITNKFLGEIVNGFDEREFSEAMTKLIHLVENNPNKIKNNCIKMAQQKFSYEYTSSEYIKIYEGLI